MYTVIEGSDAIKGLALENGKIYYPNAKKDWKILILLQCILKNIVLSSSPRHTFFLFTVCLYNHYYLN